MNKRGFLGPIGDDLPSLIPIIFGLVIFFAVFNVGFQTFQDKSRSFDAGLNILTISDVLKGESVVNDYADFKSKCDKVNLPGVNFKAVLIEFPDPDELLSDYPAPEDREFHIFDLLNFDDASPGIILKSPDGDPFICPEEPNDEVSENKELAVRVFPMAFIDTSIQTKADFAIKPAFLVVVVWR